MLVWSVMLVETGLFEGRGVRSVAWEGHSTRWLGRFLLGLDGNRPRKSVISYIDNNRSLLQDLLPSNECSSSAAGSNRAESLVGIPAVGSSGVE